MYLVYVIYLAESGPSCGRQDLCSSACGILFFSPNIYLFVYLGALGFSCGMWDLVPWPGIEPGPLALGVWRLSVCATMEAPECIFITLYAFRAARKACLAL